MTSPASPRVSFRVSNVKSIVAEEKLETCTLGFRQHCGKPRGDLTPELICPDAISQHSGILKDQLHNHGFLSAVLIAFNCHLPLTLRPEHFWTLILQAVALHVNENAEKLRSNFVTFAGKQELVVRRDDFKLNEEGNDWAAVVREFGMQISSMTVPGTGDLLATNFSSTTDVERVAGQVTIMDMVQNFFEYKVYTLCGFPKITLEGTSEDWHLLRAKAEALLSQKCDSDFSSWWCLALLPVLDRLVTHYDNPDSVDVEFWESFCKNGGWLGSGSEGSIDGWVNVFFPILKDNAKNEFCIPYYAKVECSSRVKDNRLVETGPDVDKIPTGIAQAPVRWIYFQTEIPLAFRAGFAGAILRRDGSISPDLGWYIMKMNNRDVRIIYSYCNERQRKRVVKFAIKAK